jgi:uncharacterized coiled-coil protein SlyX
VWEFIGDNPAEFVALLSLVLGSIGSIVAWMAARTEKRLNQRIKLLELSQGEQAERLSNTTKLADTLYETIQQQLDRARAVEADLRDRLAERDAEYNAQANALRLIHTKALELENDLRVCRQQNEAHLQVIRETERHHAEILGKYRQQQQEIEKLRQQVVDLQFEIQRQSVASDAIRQRLAGYDEAALDTQPLGGLDVSGNMTPSDVEDRWRFGTLDPGGIND